MRELWLAGITSIWCRSRGVSWVGIERGQLYRSWSSQPRSRLTHAEKRAKDNPINLKPEQLKAKLASSWVEIAKSRSR